MRAKPLTEFGAPDHESCGDTLSLLHTRFQCFSGMAAPAVNAVLPSENTDVSAGVGSVVGVRPTGVISMDAPGGSGERSSDIDPQAKANSSKDEDKRTRIL